MRTLLPALVCALLWATQISAQAPAGTVAGRVFDEATDAPVSGVTVSIGDRGALTNENGRFLVTAVPAGTYLLRASHIAYTEATREITVVAGETTSVEIPLSVQALALEGIVVTGYGERQVRDLTGVIDNVEPAEFNTGRIVSPEELIQGKVAGVQVIDSGEPGGGISLRIRGGTSVTSSNEPLFVVDGVPLAIGGGLSAGRNPLNFLNPDDIAEITVLKDASATAIYGSRGANGVVMIQTKRGVSGSQLSYRGSVSGSNVIREPDILDADRFRAAVSEWAPEQMDLLGSASTDWQDAVQRSATGQEHSVAFSGGGGDVSYRLSLGYLDQDGVVRGSSTERLSLGLNYDHLFFDDALKVTANLKGSRADDEFTPGGVLGAANAFAPTEPILDPGSEFGGFFEWDAALAPNNPVAELELISDEGTTYRSVGNLQARYRLPFLDDLSATARLGYDVTKAERQFFAPSFVRWQAETGQGGTVSRSTPTDVHTVLELFANYGRTLADYDSDIDLTAGYSYEESRGDFPSFFAQGLSFDLLGPNAVPAAELERTFLDVQESKLVSGFARLNYTLRDRYLLTLSVRRDGSSRFGPDQQWGTFPSAAFAWRAGDEAFLQDVDWLSDLKLRASWGVNGNQAFANYQAFSTYTIGGPLAQAQFGDRFVTTIRPSAADPGIKWEETTSYNVGLDYGILDGRFSGSVDYYRKETEDLIFTVPVAAGTNLSNFVTTNIGTLENQGLELSLDAVVLDGARGGLSWTAGFTASTNDNELTRINPVGGGSEQILTGGIAGGVGSMIQVLQPGHPINSFFVFRHRRNPDGSPVYADTNGDGTINEQDLYVDLNDDGQITVGDRAPFESPAPDWMLGHTSLLRYGSFDLGFTVRAHFGNYVYNNVASDLGNFRRLRDSGAPVNLHASVLETGFENPQYFSDVYVEDASFVRMDNLTLGYSFDRLRSFQQVRVFGTVQKVFTLTDYDGVDPEAGVNGIDNNIYPFSRTFTAGVSVAF